LIFLTGQLDTTISSSDENIEGKQQLSELENVTGSKQMRGRPPSKTTNDDDAIAVKIGNGENATNVISKPATAKSVADVEGERSAVSANQVDNAGTDLNEAYIDGVTRLLTPSSGPSAISEATESVADSGVSEKLPNLNSPYGLNNVGTPSKRKGRPAKGPNEPKGTYAKKLELLGPSIKKTLGEKVIIIF
jgi:hypothetical protein